MLLKNFALRVLSVLFLVTILLLGVLLVPAQAKSSVRPLQADGDFAWAGAFTGPDLAAFATSAVDASGNVYTTGRFSGTFDFDPGAGIANLTSTGSYSNFITKLDSNGNFVWAEVIADRVTNIAVDSNSNVYITGYFSGTVDFDPGPGTFNLTSTVSTDIFIAKFDSAGNFVWAKNMDGTGGGSGYGIAVDSSGNIYSTGLFDDTTDFDPGAGTVNLTPIGNEDVFILKLDTDGNYVWVKNFGGAGGSGTGNDITVDATGNVYITGQFSGTLDFDPGAGIANLASAGGDDIFVSKLDGAGDDVWAQSAGSAFGDYGEGIAVDVYGRIYISGEFASTTDFDPGAGTHNLSTSAPFSAFVWSLYGDGSFYWANNLGNNQYNGAWEIAVDSTGTFVYIVGDFSGTVDFDPSPATANLTSAGTSMYICKLATSGVYIWAKQVGPTAMGLGIGLDASNKLYVSGNFIGTVDFDPGAGTSNLTSLGATYNIFVMKFDNLAVFPTNVPTFTPIPSSTWTPSPAPTVTQTATNTDTASATATASVTSTVTQPPSPTVTQTATPAAVTISLPSNALQDGWILESTENSNAGGGINNIASTLNLGDDASKKQYRSILSFNTGSLPDTAVITSITLKLKQQAIIGGGNPVSIFNGLMIDIKNGFFGSAATLQTTDFQAVASKTYGPTSPALTGGFYNVNLTSGKAFINKLAASNSLTQIRIRFKLDDNNNAVANMLSLYSGNAATPANRPQLVITYYVP